MKLALYHLSLLWYEFLFRAFGRGYTVELDPEKILKWTGESPIAQYEYEFLYYLVGIIGPYKFQADRLMGESATLRVATKQEAVYAKMRWG